MPERNLVAKLRNDNRFILLIAALTIVTMYSGCSKFRQTTLGQGFLDSKWQPNWPSDSTNSTSGQEPADEVSNERPADREDAAQMVRVTEDAIESDSNTVKLVAHQPVADTPCDHQANCDCFKRQLKPKLPYAEPIEPPSEIAMMTPPTNLVSQPLSPVLFDGPNEAIQNNENPSRNSSLHTEHGSIEREASIVKPESVPRLPDRIAATEVDVHPIRINPADDRVSQPIRNYNWSDATQSEANCLAPPATSNCPCDGPTCDGRCKTHSSRNRLSPDLPVGEPEQTSLISTQSLPPFGERAPDRGFESQATDFVTGQKTTTSKTELAAVESKSIENLNDQQWSDISGPADEPSQNCPRCTSKNCNNPDCGKALAAAISEFETKFESDDFQLPQNEVEVDLIGVASTEEFDNDFSVASHAVDVGETEPEIGLTQFVLPNVDAAEPMPQRHENAHIETLEVPPADPLTVDDFVSAISSPGMGELPTTREPSTNDNDQPVESMVDFRIINVALCTEVKGFGQFKPFPTASFEAGQRMLVYCELENFASKQTIVDFESRFVTRLRGRYEIHNAEGRVVQVTEYPVVEDIARNQRQDFYMHFPVQLGDLPPGPYQIELRVEDLNGNKTATLSTGMEFNIR